MKYALIVITGFIVFACGPKQLEKEALVSWHMEHTEDMSNEQTFGALTFKATYLPADLMAARNCSECGTAELKNAAEGQQQYTQFKLRISSANTQDVLSEDVRNENEYNARRDYYENGMADDVFVVSGKDTLSCIMHHMERNYKTLPYSDILLAFGPRGLPGDAYLVVNDRVFGKGYIKFYFPKEIFEKSPTLKI